MDDRFTPDPAATYDASTPVPVPVPPGPDAGAARAWPALCEQFALRILSAAYQTGGQLAAVEAEEQDPGRLAQFYRIDHANTRIRRQAENLLVLAGRTVDDAGRQITSLLDVVRAGTSAIEHYPRVRLGVIAHLAVVDFAADDVIRVLTEVLDNATRFSPPAAPVTVSAHLTEVGSVLLRVEDTGLGFAPAQLVDVNNMLASAVPVTVAEASATRLGLLVVQRLAAAHRIGVRLTARPGGGTTATVLLPAGLLCEIPSAPEPPPHTPPPRPLPPPSPGQLPPPPLSGQLPPPPRNGSELSGGRNSSELSGGRNGGNPAGPRNGSDPSAQRNGHGPAGQRNGAGVPAAGPARTNLPRREPASLRGDVPPPRPIAPGGPAVGSDQLAWPDETIDFAAGFRDGREPHPGNRSEGHRDDQPA
ncbi:ATP-binding protein [Micromonospora sp. NPDC049523]|uniref:sensor histidine kinase n=1 Tax=Micromonospora sp. NPDC049523 TaxID=3155921 RepID=UPI00342FFBE0